MNRPARYKEKRMHRPVLGFEEQLSKNKSDAARMREGGGESEAEEGMGEEVPGMCVNIADAGRKVADTRSGNGNGGGAAAAKSSGNLHWTSGGASRVMRHAHRISVSCYFGARCRNARCRFGHGEENSFVNSVSINTRFRRDSGASGGKSAAGSSSRDANSERRECYFGVNCRHVLCR